MDTSVITFNISTAFDDWAQIYDKSTELQKQAGIKSLFRGVSKDDPTKCIAIMQAQSGVLEKFMKENAEMVSQSGHVIESTVITIYKA